MRKKILYTGVLVAIGAAIIGAGLADWSGDAVPAYHPDNLIRIHVIPHSDAQIDQDVKHRVREAITEAMRPQLDGLTDVNDARTVVTNHLDLVQQTAAHAVRAAGGDYPVRVCFGTFDFPTRRYGDLVVPEGKYQAVRVVLGNGNGANWWCVLFPPLCFVHSDADTPEEAVAAREGRAPVRVKMKLRTVELWEKSTDLARQAARHLT